MSARYYGPFPILEKLSPVTYRLQLPATTRACDVFHVSLLRSSLFPGGPSDASFPSDPELFPFLPAAILQVRLVLRRRRRLVQWDGRPLDEATWESYDVFSQTPFLQDQARTLQEAVRDSSVAVSIPADDVLLSLPPLDVPADLPVVDSVADVAIPVSPPDAFLDAPVGDPPDIFDDTSSHAPPAPLATY